MSVLSGRPYSGVPLYCRDPAAHDHVQLDINLVSRYIYVLEGILRNWSLCWPGHSSTCGWADRVCLDYH